MTERLASHRKTRVDVLENTDGKPIVFFDLETTGRYPKSARIVSFAALKLTLTDTGDVIEEVISLMINPGADFSIEKGASEVHGIYDEDVENSPTFDEAAPLICKFFQNSIIIGYNSQDYDRMVFMSEIIRSNLNIRFDPADHVWIDCMKIWWDTNRLCSGKLHECHKHYTGLEHTGAHNALDDINATYNIFFQQMIDHKNYRSWFDGASSYPFETYNWNAMEGVRPWYKGDKYVEKLSPPSQTKPVQTTMIPSKTIRDAIPKPTYEKFLTPTPYGDPKGDFIINFGRGVHRGRALSEIKNDPILAENVIWYALGDGYKSDPVGAKTLILSKTQEMLTESPVKHLLKVSRELMKSCKNDVSKRKITWFHDVLRSSNRVDSPTMKPFIKWAKQNSYIS